MSCYHPLKLFTVGTHKSKTGKLVNTNIVKPYDTEYLELKDGKKLYDYIEIPCGKCIGCRLEYSRQWANRCLLEMQDHEQSYFVTLTYDDEHVPMVAPFSRIDTGETDITSYTLRKRDFQLFMKRLRKAYGEKYDNRIRYFACGEYGPSTLRPHYHSIMFGLKLDDLVLDRKSKKGFNMYKSEFLESVWPNGFVDVEDCTWETCAYTARYVMKKLSGDAAEEYEYYNMEQPFILSSRNPGIGRNYYESHPRLFDCDVISASRGVDGGYSFSPPRYFRRLKRESDSDFWMSDFINSQELAENSKKLKALMSSQSYLDMLASEEANVIARTNSLVRDDL